MNKVKKYLWAVFATVLLMTGIFASGKTIVWADGSCTGLLDPYWQRGCNDYYMLKENVKTQQQSVTMNGKKYYHGMFKNKYAYVGDATYALNGAYESVSFYTGMMDDSGLLSSLQKQNITVKVYLDGKQTDIITIVRGEAVKLHTIATKGVQQLRFKIEGAQYTIGGIANVSATGHQWKLSEKLAAGVETSGTAVYVCENCDASRTETLAAQKNCTNYLTPYETGSNLYSYETGQGNTFLINGIEYDQGLFSNENWGREHAALYNLDGAYSSVEFIVGPSAVEAKRTNGHVNPNYDNIVDHLKIYLDNQLYKDVEITIWDWYHKITVPTAGVSILKIEIVKDAGVRYGIANVKGNGGPGHTFESEILLQPQIGKTGVQIDTCTKCGASKKIILPALPDENQNTNAGQNGQTGQQKNDAAGNTYVISANQTAAFQAPKKNAKTVTIPKTVTIEGKSYKVTKIAANAFKNNKKLTKVTIGSNIREIGTNAFYGCTKLTTVVMGSNIQTIGDRAFYKCTSLKKIVIPSKVVKIGQKAFYGDKKLASVQFKTSKLSKKTIGSKAFSGTAKKITVTAPKKVKKSYKKILKARGMSSKLKMK